MNEKRKEMRHETISIFDYTVPYHEDGLQSAVTINISPSGLMAYFFELITPGQVIIIKNLLPHDRNRRAAVQWIKKETEGFCKAGLKFEAPVSADYGLSNTTMLTKGTLMNPLVATCEDDSILLGLESAGIPLCGKNVESQ